VKNRYGSTLEVLSHVQIWYVEKETRELVRIQQCELWSRFTGAKQLRTEHRTGGDQRGRGDGAADHEVAEPMFRLILLAVREIERTGDWALPLSYFAFWTVRLGGWLPRFDRCSLCAAPFGEGAAYHAPWEPGLLCEKCRRPGMKASASGGSADGERFAGQSLERIERQYFK